MNHINITITVLIICIVTAIESTGAHTTVSNIELRNAKNQKSWIPGFGEKVIIIIYTDYESRKFSRPLANISHKYRKEKRFKGMGIINLKDNPLFLPGWLVKLVIKKNETKYKTELLFDEDHLLRDRWGHGDCDNKSVILIIGKDKKVKYQKKITSQKQCEAIVHDIISFITNEVKKSS